MATLSSTTTFDASTANASMTHTTCLRIPSQDKSSVLSGTRPSDSPRLRRYLPRMPGRMWYEWRRHVATHAELGAVPNEADVVSSERSFTVAVRFGCSWS